MGYTGLRASDITSFVVSFRNQAAYCAGVGGSPLYARLFNDIADAIPAHLALQQLLEGYASTWQASLPLRIAGALHFLALNGEAPNLARLLPSCGGMPDFSEISTAAIEQIEQHSATIARFIERHPQTNEPGRSAILLPGFLEVDRVTGRPLALLEIGASAGINLCWDRFSYDLGPYGWGDGSVAIKAEWRGPAAAFERRPTVVARRGCDRAPIDLTDIKARKRLEAFIWPDHLSRMERLRAAIALVLRETPRVDREDAATWLPLRLASRPAGACTVIVHTVVWQYLGTDTRAAINAAIDAEATRATADTPLARLSFEPGENHLEYRLTLAIWPGAATHELAVAHPHGTWIEWRGV